MEFNRSKSQKDFTGSALISVFGIENVNLSIGLEQQNSIHSQHFTANISYFILWDDLKPFFIYLFFLMPMLQILKRSPVFILERGKIPRNRRELWWNKPWRKWNENSWMSLNNLLGQTEFLSISHWGIRKSRSSTNSGKLVGVKNIWIKGWG